MIGFLPQAAELDPDFPISLEQVVMQGRYRRLGFLRWPGRADREAVRRALATVGLADARPAPVRRALGRTAAARASWPGRSPRSRACSCSTSPSTDSTSRIATRSSTPLRTLKARGRRGARLDARPRAREARLRSRRARERHAARVRPGRRRAHARQRAGVLRGRRGRDSTSTRWSFPATRDIDAERGIRTLGRTGIRWGSGAR